MEVIILFLITIIIYLIIDKYSERISLFYESKKEYVIKMLMLKRAYIGYAWFVTHGEKKGTPKTFNDFCDFEFWKIEMSFRIYRDKYKDVDFSSPESYDIYSIRVLIFNK